MIEDFDFSGYYRKHAEPLDHHRLRIELRGEWFATLVGPDPDALRERAERFTQSVYGSQVVE